MFLHSLSIADFRCYDSVDLSFGRDLVLLYGPNAQGKTNLLEAAFFALKGRSFRTHDLRKLIRQDSEGARAQVVVKTQEDLDVTYEAAIRTDGLRIHRRNGTRLKRSDLHSRETPVVPISAEDSRIVTDEPAARREFLDSELSQTSSKYLVHLAGYKKALEQKGRLLRRGLSEEPIREEELASWNIELSRNGAVLMSARSEFVASLSEEASGIYRAVSGGSEQLAIRYDPKTECSGSEGEIAKRILQDLSEIAGAEIAAGRCLRGPHKDDVAFLIDGSSARDFASRGQVRSVVLAARIALVRMLRRINNESPLVLFDDFDNDLDEGRRQRLLDLLDTAQQVFVAAHDLGSCTGAEIGRADVFDIKDGKVSAAQQGAYTAS